MWVVVFFSVASAVMYFLKFWRKVDAGIKLRRRKDLLRLERRQKRMEARAAAEAASARRVEA
jgi:CDP-diacylglycerol--glycerol-3-phosphate 3-phosphatidyltransferase